MPFSSSPFALIGAIIAAGFCLVLAFQAGALLLPFLLSSPYQWAPLCERGKDARASCKLVRHGRCQRNKKKEAQKVAPSS